MAKKRVLIVEDEAIVAFDLKLLLESLGFEVIAILTDGGEAVSYSRVNEPDLIMMDVFLSDNVSGIEAVREIRKSVGSPVVYISASTDPETYAMAETTEFVGFITKPYSETDVAKTVKAFL